MEFEIHGDLIMNGKILKSQTVIMQIYIGRSAKKKKESNLIKLILLIMLKAWRNGRIHAMSA